MAVQRFDEFCGKEKPETTKKVDRVQSVPTEPVKKIDPKVLRQIQKTGKIPAPKFSNYNDLGKRVENAEVKFNGKIVQFPDNTKPSQNYKLLEERNVSKEKLHFMVNKQNNNSIVIVKYNEKVDIELKEFVEQLMSYYRQNKILEEFLAEVIVEGNETFSIVKNIPNLEFKEKPLIDVITNDLMKLLK